MWGRDATSRPTPHSTWGRQILNVLTYQTGIKWNKEMKIGRQAWIYGRMNMYPAAR